MIVSIVGAGLLGVWLSACSSGTATPARRGVVEIGRQGLQPGRFNFPREIIINPRNELYVFDKTGRIQWLRPDGYCLGTWNVPDASNGTPTGATFDLDGNLLVADTHYSRILRYSPDGTTMTQFGEYGEGVGQIVYPTDVAVDRAGNIYITNFGHRDRVMKFDPDGTFLKEWGDTGEGAGEFRRPMGLAVLQGREIVVADSCNHRVQRFDLDGTFLGVMGEVGSAKGQLNYPYDIATDPEGRIYVAEYGNNRISVFSAAGRFLETFGGPGNGLGLFRGPWGVALDGEGNLYVADTYNHRLQRIEAGLL